MTHTLRVLKLPRKPPISHPDPEKILCVFADTSETHWGSVITQIPANQTQREFEAQDQQPLMFLSRTFSNAALR